MKKIKYLIHDDLNNENRKRIDLFNRATLTDIKELENFNIQIQEQWTEGTTVKMYVILEEKTSKSYDGVTVQQNKIINQIANKINFYNLNGEIISDCGYTWIIFKNLDKTITLSPDDESDIFYCYTERKGDECPCDGQLRRNEREIKTLKGLLSYISIHIDDDIRE